MTVHESTTESTTETTVVDTVEQPTAVVRRRVALNALTEFFESAFDDAAQELDRQGSPPSGPPFAYYHGTPTDMVDVEAGYPVSVPIRPSDGVLASTLPAGRAVTATHIGPYDTLPATYGLVQQRIEQEGLLASQDMWETYLVDPQTEPDPARWRTDVFWLVS